jgi:Zn-finger nucleic acid-binding protein
MRERTWTLPSLMWCPQCRISFTPTSFNDVLREKCHACQAEDRIEVVALLREVASGCPTRRPASEVANQPNPCGSAAHNQKES